MAGLMLMIAGAGALMGYVIVNHHPRPPAAAAGGEQPGLGGGRIAGATTSGGGQSTTAPATTEAATTAEATTEAATTEAATTQAATTEAATTQAATTAAATTQAQAAGGADLAAGKKVFTSAGCTACHTLKDAGATGTVGPNLDQAKPPKSLVIERVTNGKGAMPPFKGQLSPQQIDAVATYVSSVAGKS